MLKVFQHGWITQDSASVLDHELVIVLHVEGAGSVVRHPVIVPLKFDNDWAVKLLPFPQLDPLIDLIRRCHPTRTAE